MGRSRGTPFRDCAEGAERANGARSQRIHESRFHAIKPQRDAEGQRNAEKSQVQILRLAALAQDDNRFSLRLRQCFLFRCSSADLCPSASLCG
jgi:hypothetical protein